MVASSVQLMRMNKKFLGPFLTLPILTRKSAAENLTPFPLVLVLGLASALASTRICSMPYVDLVIWISPLELLVLPRGCNYSESSLMLPSKRT